MCGICGVARPGEALPIEPARLLAMRDAMAVRGPDDAGHSLAPGVGLASRRLAIVDLSERGHMPMFSPDKRYQIVHNGEIYNFRELRRGLEAKGEAFRSDTDTEVLLRLFVREGAAMLPRLNGMFAFAIWDAEEHSLFLARDRLGVKPLYYAVHRDVLYFASEQKALFAAGVPCNFDPNTWEELLLFRYVAGERTPYDSVRRLLPGHSLTFRQGRLETRRWWDLSEGIRRRRGERTASAGAYRELLEDSVSLRLISDVPVGVLLSGGLDSSAVAAIATEKGTRRLGAFTCRFRETEYDEGPLARLVADRFGMAFHDTFLSNESLLSSLEEATWLQDEPLAHSSHLHMLAISRVAKKNATVLLSGEGADETLGGYERYRPLLTPQLLPAVRALLPFVHGEGRIGRRLQKLGRLLSQGGASEWVLYNSCEVLPADLESVGVALSGDWAFRREALREAQALYASPARQAMFLDQKTFLVSLLDRNDRMTMGASIECRVPFLDYRLVETAGALPSAALFSRGRGKALLRNAMKGRLPEAVRKGRKWGFGVPWPRYLREVPELAEWVAELPDSEPIRSGPFDPLRLRRAVRAFLSGEQRPALLVEALLMIALWHRTCVTDRSRAERPALSHMRQSP